MPPYDRPDRHDHAPRWLTARLLLWRVRPLLRVGAVVLVVVAVVRVVAPPPEPTVGVVVAARTVPPGQVLTAADLRTVRVPVATAPDGAVSVEAALVGSTPVVGVPEGLPVVGPLLGAGRFEVPVPSGAVVVPVRLADTGVVGLLRPGDRIDVVTAAASDTSEAPTADVLARSALVLGTTAPADAGGGGLLAGPQEDAGLLLVAVAAEDGRRLAATSTYTDLGAVLIGPGHPLPSDPTTASVG